MSIASVALVTAAHPVLPARGGWAHLVRGGHNMAAGAAPALSTVKPQPAVGVVGLAALGAMRGGRTRAAGGGSATGGPTARVAGRRPAGARLLPDA